MHKKNVTHNKLYNLKAYQLAIELTEDIEKLTKSWNSDLDYQLSDNWVVDMRLIASQMEEAYEQQAHEGHRAFLWEAIGALARSTVSLEMTNDLDILDDAKYTELKQKFDELEIELKGLAYSLRKIFGK